MLLFLALHHFIGKFEQKTKQKKKALFYFVYSVSEEGQHGLLQETYAVYLISIRRWNLQSGYRQRWEKKG